MFHEWYLRVVKDEVEKSYHCRRPVWSESLAIGSKDWVENISHGVLRVKIAPVLNTCLELKAKKSHTIYSVIGADSTEREFWPNYFSPLLLKTCHLMLICYAPNEQYSLNLLK